MRIFSCFILSITLLGLISCDDAPKNAAPSAKELKEPLMEINKAFVKSDDEKIRRFMERHNLKMTESGTGLKYAVSGDGVGQSARPGQFAKVNFRSRLLDGTVCYSSEESGPEEFLISQDNVESGLHEGITYMKQGQKAIFIMPPHLAHGLLGDKNKIPPRAIVVYDVELLNLR
jgi:FKBP-type peptidyl-prolyl cis-trans isomerase FkpA